MADHPAPPPPIAPGPTIATGNGYTCGGCDTTWTGVSRCHCSRCHHTFSGVRMFDTHQRGGRCLPPDTITKTTKAGKVVRVMFAAPNGVWFSVDEVEVRTPPRRTR